MIDLDLDLPESALANAADHRLAAVLRAAGGVWLRGNVQGFVTDAEERPVQWVSATDGSRAASTGPSEGQLQIVQQDDAAGLLCRSGTHGGMVLAGVDAAGGCSAAVIFYPHPVEPARTLLCLNPLSDGQGDYLFLSQGEDGFTLKDTEDRVVLTVPDSGAAPGAARLVVVSVSPSGIALSLDGGTPVRAAGLSAPLAPRPDLFIGCRSHRKGLMKSLGASLIRDVIFVPRRQILEPGPTPEMQALTGYFGWSC